jgi:pimeloyl-ACP methyl ester carboxylesterase
LIVPAANFAYLGFLLRRWSPGWKIPPGILAEVKHRFAAPGVVHAALSYYRQAQDRDSSAGKQSAQLLLKPISVPTLGLYGANDGCIGADIFERSMPSSDFLASLHMARIDHAGHFFHLEQPSMVNALLLDWLTEAKAARAN